ncbi:MAG: zinc ribbon domain-containing protein [Opitutaceae bacterium]|nr:zinc ribbon domain-containing protein [Opitutaceae bacterium]
MTTYVYETIPQKPGEKPRYFEIKQSMSDKPLTRHPDSGETIRRVMLGGFGVLSSSPKKSSANADTGGSCCGGTGCCD